MAEEITTQPPNPEAQLSDADKQALARAQGETGDYTADNFNEDGTPKNEFSMPEKFEGKSAEEIAKAYIELEKLKTEQASKEPQKGAEDTKEPKEGATTPDTKDEAQESSEGFTPNDFKVYEEAYLKDGQLTEDHYKELKSKGFNKEMVDAYIRGQEAVGKQFTNAIYETAGGEEGYTELVTWAKDNLSEVAISDFNEKIKSGNVELAQLAVSTIQAQMGTPPRRVDGTSNQDQGGVKPFSDKAEWHKFVRDPMYGKDRNYTMMVDNRYLKAKTAGKI